jgi:hypothetical protein
MTGHSCTEAGSNAPSSPWPFDTIFWFSSTINDFSLVLETAFPVANGGSDSLIPPSGSTQTLAGSFEYCTENATACGGPGYLAGRLIAGGTLYAPESASLSLRGTSCGLLTLLSRRRATVKRGAA